MKRILISMICLIMCCSISIAPVSAAQGQTNFTASGIDFVNLIRYNTNQSVSSTAPYNIPGTMVSENVFHFDTNISIVVVQGYGYGAQFNIRGSWNNDPGSNPLLFFTFRFSLSPDSQINFDRLLTVPIALNLYYPDDNVITLTDVAVANESANSYLLTFGNVSIDPQLSFDLVNDLLYMSLLAPIEVTGGTRPELGVITGIDCNLYCEVTYQLPDINYDELILGSIENGNMLLDEVITNQDTIVSEIIATQDVISAVSGKLDSIQQNQQTTIVTLQQLPGQIVSGLINGNVGSDYNKQLDTSEIVAYESALDRVMEEVDVDQVIDIMGDGVSLNQPGMYNDQSFNSVSDLMTNIIDATGIMPLITLTLSIGLACFIIGRSGKL